MNLPRFVTRNLRLKVLSLVIAMVTWAGVVYASNPPETRVFTLHVPQSATSIPAKFVLTRTIPDVSILIAGTRERLDAFDTRSLVLHVDFTKIKSAGIVDLPLSISNSDPNVVITQQPPTVQADIDTISSTTVAVQLVLNPPPPLGYVVAQQSVTPAQVILEGPTHELAQAQARITLDLSNQKTNLDSDRAVLLFGQHGTAINDVGVSPPTVRVSLTLQATQTSRSTAVLPPTTGHVASGYELAGMSVDPATVVINGPRDLLNALDSIPTTPVALDGLKADTTVTVNLAPPAGVTSAQSVITVTLQIIPLPSATPAPTPAAPTP